LGWARSGNAVAAFYPASGKLEPVNLREVLSVSRGVLTAVFTPPIIKLCIHNLKRVLLIAWYQRRHFRVILR
jgi:hypothetical protein